jgi:hypothetical protein
MLDDIPASPAQLAKYLGIKESTLRTYKRQGAAPLPVLRALFWETRWGRAAADQEAARFGVVHYQHAQSLQHELGRLAGIIWRLEVELARADQRGQAANLPIWRVR